MLPAHKLESVEAVAKQRVKAGEYSREPTEKEWAEVWQLIKARPSMPDDLIADTVFAHLRPGRNQAGTIAAHSPAPRSQPSPAPAPTPRPTPPAVADLPIIEGGKVCPSCNRMVAANTRTCPNCGHTFTTAGGVFIAILIALILGGVFFFRVR